MKIIYFIFISYFLINIQTINAQKKAVKVKIKNNYQILFSKDRSIASIKYKNTLLYELFESETNYLKDMIEAISMKIYPNQEAMMIDYISFLKSYRLNDSFIANRGNMYCNKKLNEASKKVLQVLSVVEINRFRKTKNLKDLLFDIKLLSVAQAYADYNTKLNRKELSHFDEEGNGVKSRVDKIFYGFGAQENMYRGCGLPKETIEMFIESPGHYANLILEKARYVAVGVSQYPNGKLVYVQNFIYKWEY